METRLLKIFLSVAKAGSVSGAAKELHYAQSNVTARIKQLEEEIGASLFTRKSRGMALTPEGRVLQKYAERILHLVQQAAKAVKDSLNIGGELVVGSMETAAALHLPRILPRFHRQNAAVKLTLLTGTSEEMFRMLLEHKLDCAFVGGEINHPEILSREIFSEELVLIGEDSMEALQARENLTLLAYREGCAYRARTEQWLSQNGVRHYTVMEFASMDAILGCIDAKMGFAVLPRSALAKRGGAPCAVRTLPPEVSRVKTNFIYHRDAAFTHSMKSFLATVQEIFAQG